MLLSFFVIGSGFVKNDSTEISERKKRKNIVRTAQKYIGCKYRSGGKTAKGFDCSGFAYCVMKENNIQLKRSSRDQALQGEPIKISKLKPGDLIFFASKSRINHVGIISENGRNSLKMIHASSSRGIIEEDILKSTYWQQRIKEGRSVL